MEANNNSTAKTLFFTTCALIAFAANSVLCRLALGDETIDAASFTIIRLLSGAITLLFILKLSSTSISASKGTWAAAFMLFLYAATFSYAYITLDTGTGALILFGTVQITIILITVFTGGRLHITEWIGSTSLLAYIVTIRAVADQMGLHDWAQSSTASPRSAYVRTR